MKKVSCRLCGNEYKQITNTHLSSKHGLTTEEYKSKFPNSPLGKMTKEERNRQSERAKEAMNRSEVREKLKRKLTPSQPKFWMEKKGLSKSEAEKRARQNQIRAHKNRNSESYKSIWQVDFWIDKGLSEEKAKQKVSEIQSRNSENSSRFDGKSHTEESKRKIASSMSSVIDEKKSEWVNHFKSDGFGSKLEKKIADWIRSEIRNDIEQNVEVETGDVVDIIVEEKIVEVYGDFWHCHPKMFDGEEKHPVLEQTAKSIRQQDQERKTRIQQEGYDVIEVWETDWIENNQQAKSQIKNFL